MSTPASGAAWPTLRAPAAGPTAEGGPDGEISADGRSAEGMPVCGPPAAPCPPELRPHVPALAHPDAPAADDPRWAGLRLALDRAPFRLVDDRDPSGALVGVEVHAAPGGPPAALALASPGALREAAARLGARELWATAPELDQLRLEDAWAWPPAGRGAAALARSGGLTPRPLVIRDGHVVGLLTEAGPTGPDGRPRPWPPDDPAALRAAPGEAAFARDLLLFGLGAGLGWALAAALG